MENSNNGNNGGNPKDDLFKKSHEQRLAGLKDLEQKLADLKSRQGKGPTAPIRPEMNDPAEEISKTEISGDKTGQYRVAGQMSDGQGQVEESLSSAEYVEPAGGIEEYQTRIQEQLRRAQTARGENDNPLATWFEGLLGSEFFQLPLKVMKISKMEEILNRASFIAMACIAIFVSSAVLLLVLPQFSKGLSGIFAADVNDVYFNFLRKLDSGFSNNHVILTLLFIPVVISLCFFLLHLLERYLDELLGILTVPNFSKKLSLYWIILSVSIWPIIGTFVFAIAHTFFGFEYSESKIFSTFFIFIQMGMTVLLLSFVYKMLSKGVFSWQSAFRAGTWAGVLTDVTKLALLAFLVRQGSVSPFAAIMIATIFTSLWLIFVAIVFSFGARVGYYCEFRELFSDNKIEYLNKSEARPAREIGLIGLLELTRRYYSTRDGMGLGETIGLSLGELCHLVIVTPARAKEVMEHITKVGLVKIFMDNEREVLVLNFSPERLTLNDFLSRLEIRPGIDVQGLTQFYANRWFWEQYYQVLKKNFGQMSIKDLYELEEQKEKPQS